MTKKPELLAPAGSVESLKSALLAGADAVYLAGKRFGARAFASNFDEDNLRWARKVTWALGKKLYVTLNTIVFEHEWNLLNKTLDFLEELEPDALIVQDLGVATELRKRNTSIPLHLSTQGAWFGQGGIVQLEELGFTRVILPREATKSEITEIVNRSPFEIEVFVHGAMCYSISGRCFWSSTLGPRSGNRGTCAQPCRRDYIIDGTKTCSCLFSPRDMRLINEINSLKETGVASLKIEGRMKSPEYVYQVVKAYRSALDGNSNIDNKALDEVFSRASSVGFFNGVQRPLDWKTGNNPGREGIVVGIATGRCSDGLTELVKNTDIKAGDGLFWYEGNEHKGARITFAEVDKKYKNRIWVRGLPRNLANGTELRRTSKSSDENWGIKWERCLERSRIVLFWKGAVGKPLTVEALIHGKKVSAQTEELLVSAQLKGLDEGPIQDKFNAIGEDYVVSEHNTECLETKLYITTSALKQLKRSLAEKLSIAVNTMSKPSISATACKSNFILDKKSAFITDCKAKPSIRLRLWNNDFPFTGNIDADKVILPWLGNNKKAINLIGEDRIIYWLPPLLNYKQFKQTYHQLERLNHGTFLCFGWEAFSLSKFLPKLNFELDWCCNIANLNSIAFTLKSGLGIVLSKEWKYEDIPANLNATIPAPAWNPLVSFTRFADAVKTEQEILNSHNDRFFVLPIGNGVTAMFLESKATKISEPIGSIQLDVAISPKENPTQVAEQLNRIFAGYRKLTSKR